MRLHPVAKLDEQPGFGKGRSARCGGCDLPRHGQERDKAVRPDKEMAQGATGIAAGAAGRAGPAERSQAAPHPTPGRRAPPGMPSVRSGQRLAGVGGSAWVDTPGLPASPRTHRDGAPGWSGSAPASTVS